jgi:hypothetical protein
MTDEVGVLSNLTTLVRLHTADEQLHERGLSRAARTEMETREESETWRVMAHSCCLTASSIGN